MSAEGCGRLDEIVAELALGLLDGAERATALAHIERCGDCQAEVAALTAVGEQLLLLAPEVPPPAGFESRVLTRIAPAPEGLSPLGPSGAGQRRWLRSRTMLLAAAAVMIVVTAVGAWLGPLSGSDGGGDEAAAATADMLSPRGEVVGEATLRDGSPQVMEIDLRDWLDAMEEHGGRLDDPWWLAVEGEDGTRHMYPVTLSRASASEVSLRSGTDEVAAVALVDDDGQTWCSGRFPT
ncbi:MAG: hypothetical protein ACRD2C_02575 [Acidimicrobiales bacterium]